MGLLCLRAWPPDQPSAEQLSFMHHVLSQVHTQGLTFIPQPLRSQDGETFVQHDGLFWELTPWMPGKADFHDDPNQRRLQAAMQSLARFHLAAAAAHSTDPVAISPTLQRRLRELRLFLNGPAADELRQRVPDGRWPELDQRAVVMLEQLDRHRSELDAMLHRPLPHTPLQPVIRDVWHDHVLFENDAVRAIIDFGAMSIDTVAVDVARLVGSLADGDTGVWWEGLEAYSAVRPLSAAERSLLVVLDRSGVFAGGLIWLRWHYLDKRVFENRAGVLSRVDHFLQLLSKGQGSEDSRSSAFSGELWRRR
jgi:homoserine kinase type II